MLCSQGLQSTLSPFIDLYCPVHSLSVEVKSLELVDKLQHKILEKKESFQTTAALQLVSYQLQKAGEHFGHTQLFSRGAVCQAGEQEAKNQRKDREEAVD